jgi:hypothetical protein
LKNNEFYDENSYSLPRLANGFKGDELMPMVVPVVAQPKVREDSHQTSALMKGSMKVKSFPNSTVGSSHHSGSGNNNGNRSGNNSPTEETMRLRSTSGAGDEASIISDLTNDQQRNSMSMTSGGIGSKRHSGTKKLSRKSMFDTSQLAINSGNIAGRNLLSGTMCEFSKDESVDGTIAEMLKKDSVEDPLALLGWQVKEFLQFELSVAI